MTLSATALQSALAPETDEVWLNCLTFEHPDLIEPIRLVDDKVNLVRTAGTFIAFPFTYQDYVRGDEQVAQAIITADNVDQRLVEALRGLDSVPTVTYEMVVHSEPNTVIKGPMEFEVMGFQAALGTISLRISYALGFLNEAYPALYHAPWNAE